MENEDRIITIPNLLSFFRFCLIPVLIWSYCVEKNYVVTGLFLLLSGVTDLADGFIARKFHMTSKLGKILDPVADKATQGVMVFCLFTRFPHMIILFVLFVVKELYMAVSGCMLIRKTGQVDGADWHGKVVTFLLYGMVILHILWVNIPIWVSDLSILICAAMMVFSLIVYFIGHERALKKVRK